MQTNVDRAIIGYVTKAFRKDRRSMPQYPNEEIFDMDAMLPQEGFVENKGTSRVRSAKRFAPGGQRSTSNIIYELYNY